MFNMVGKLLLTKKYDKNLLKANQTNGMRLSMIVSGLIFVGDSAMNN